MGTFVDSSDRNFKCKHRQSDDNSINSKFSLSVGALELYSVLFEINIFDHFFPYFENRQSKQYSGDPAITFILTTPVLSHLTRFV